MKVFALSDVHLSFSGPHDQGRGASGKPMDVFGPRWQRSAERIYHNWRETVGQDDAVLIPGDISWAMTLKDAAFDLAFLASLGGDIVITRGNHDYWWQTVSLVRAAGAPRIRALQNDALVLGGKAICGSRGWSAPGSPDYDASDEKIYARELLRLEMSLKEGKKTGLPLAVMLHYPPLVYADAPTAVSELLTAYGAELCVYGHLHGDACKKAVEGVIGGTRYIFASADHLDFRPRLLWEC